MKTLQKPFLFIICTLTILFGCKYQPKNGDSAIPVYTDWLITDSIVERAIEKELLHHPEVPSHLVDVETVNGVTRLSGSTDNILSRERAEEIAGAVKGVKGVINLIEVKPVRVEDDEIRRLVLAALYQDPITDSYEYEVNVNNGRVEIYGTVDSWPEREHAGHVAKSIKGVREVENHVVFVYKGEPRADLEILADVNEILYNDIYVDNDLIDVEVSGGTVRLSGTVGSVSERNRAVTKSYVPGVDTVIADNLEIEYWARDSRLREKKYVERTDEEIRRAIITTYLIDPRVKYFDIDVIVNDGVARIEGTVDNLDAKRAARENAENIIGVNRVINRIKVRPVEIPENEALKKKVVTAMEFHPCLAKYTFDVDVSNGKVFLGGKVNTYYEKDHASQVVAKVPGVVEIQNDLEVRDQDTYPYPVTYRPRVAPRLSKPDRLMDRHIREEIESELWWSPFVNEDEVNVTVEEGNVILTGTVDTPLEKKYAEINAREGGAITIENRLEVGAE